MPKTKRAKDHPSPPDQLDGASPLLVTPGASAGSSTPDGGRTRGSVPRS
jgi:hypothetical protein